MAAAPPSEATTPLVLFANFHASHLTCPQHVGRISSPPSFAHPPTLPRILWRSFSCPHPICIASCHAILAQLFRSTAKLWPFALPAGPPPTVHASSALQPPHPSSCPSTVNSWVRVVQFFSRSPSTLNISVTSLRRLVGSPAPPAPSFPGGAKSRCDSVGGCSRAPVLSDDWKLRWRERKRPGVLEERSESKGTPRALESTVSCSESACEGFGLNQTLPLGQQLTQI